MMDDKEKTTDLPTGNWMRRIEQRINEMAESVDYDISSIYKRVNNDRNHIESIWKRVDALEDAQQTEPQPAPVELSEKAWDGVLNGLTLISDGTGDLVVYECIHSKPKFIVRIEKAGSWQELGRMINEHFEGK